MDLRPLIDNWPCVTKGCTYPAQNYAETEADTTLSRVIVTIMQSDSTTADLTLDSNSSGITITGTAPGAWAWTINEISDDTTATLDAGSYTYILKTIDTLGKTYAEFTGTWEIHPSIP